MTLDEAKAKVEEAARKMREARAKWEAAGEAPGWEEVLFRTASQDYVMLRNWAADQSCEPWPCEHING